MKTRETDGETPAETQGDAGMVHGYVAAIADGRRIRHVCRFEQHRSRVTRIQKNSKYLPETACNFAIGLKCVRIRNNFHKFVDDCEHYENEVPHFRSQDFGCERSAKAPRNSDHQRLPTMRCRLQTVHFECGHKGSHLDGPEVARLRSFNAVVAGKYIPPGWHGVCAVYV